MIKLLIKIYITIFVMTLATHKVHAYDLETDYYIMDEIDAQYDCMADQAAYPKPKAGAWILEVCNVSLRDYEDYIEEIEAADNETFSFDEDYND